MHKIKVEFRDRFYIISDFNVKCFRVLNICPTLGLILLLLHTYSSKILFPSQENWFTSAEHRKGRHWRDKVLTISKFTSFEPQRSERSDRPPNSLVIKGKSRGGEKKERRRREGWLSPFRKTYYNLLRWHKLYIWCVHSDVKPHVLSALLKYCSSLQMWDFIRGLQRSTRQSLSARSQSGRTILQKRILIVLLAELMTAPR